MKKIGVLGGSFHPIHMGHVQLAEAAIAEKGLDTVFLAVSKDPAHKELNVPFSNRYDMAVLATKDHPMIRVCDTDLNRRGKSYAIHTVEYIKSKYPDSELYYILGSDAALSLPQWYSSKKLIGMVKLLICSRKGCFIQPEELLRWLNAFGAEVEFINKAVPEISSTAIRERLRDGSDIDRTQLHPSVARYICRNHLYSGV